MNNNRNMKTFITQKLSSKSLIPKRTTNPVNTPTPVKPKPLNQVLSTTALPKKETTPIKLENKGSVFAKGGSTLGAAEKERLRQKLLLSSNKKINQPSDSFTLFDNDDYVRGNINNRIKVIKMNDFLFDNNNNITNDNEDIIRSITLTKNWENNNHREINHKEECDGFIRKAHTVAYDSEDRNIFNYVF